MTPSAFNYARPDSLSGAVALLGDPAGGASILAGGQSLVPLLVQRAVRPRLVIDINHLPGLDQIELHPEHVRMGALVRQEQARLSPVIRAEVPALSAALDWVASSVIRERGTVVGNLAANAPGSELPAVAIALGATFVVRGPGERRMAAAEVLAQDRRLPSDTLITHVLWPRSTGCGGFYEVARRDGHAPVVGAMVHLARDECRIGLCGVAPVGIACPAVAAELFARLPRGLEPAEVDRLLERDLETRYGNAFVGAAYRREIAPVVILRAIEDAVRRGHA